jgi:biotin transport system substrate-specific component
MRIIGLPFFAGGAHGWNIVIGATGGYRTGTLIIYLCGVVWLSLMLGSFSKALAAGLLPFLVGDAIKLIAAALVLPAAWKFVGNE